MRRAGDGAVDPVAAFGDRLVREGVLAASERDAIERRRARPARAAVAFAEASPEPDASRAPEPQRA